VDLTGDDDDVAKLMNNLVDLTVEEKNEAFVDLTTNVDDLEAATPPPENCQDPIPEGFDSIPSHNLNGWTFKPGDGVELEDDDIIRGERGSPDCFRIIYILRNRQTGKISYKGYRLSCTNQTAKVRKFLPRREKTLSLSNEYCIMAPSISDLESGNLEQCLESLDPRDVVRPREIIFTNELFPIHSHHQDARYWNLRTKGEQRAAGHLVVRYKFNITLSKSGKGAVKGRCERLRQEESDPHYRAVDARLREQFRPNASNAATGSTKRPHSEFTGEKTHTIGSVCTGAGGSLVGAAQVGVKPVFAVDKEPIVRKTIHLNFDKYKIIVPNMDAFDFCTSPFQGFESTDILEVSWPCPMFSPAKTRPHSDPAVDDNNLACIFATSDLLDKCRPRIATFEQTSGLVTHYPDVFESFINQILSAHYSVCWEVPDLADYEAFSHRNRLIVVAACPGEPLPTFPKPTVGTGPGMKKFSAVRDAVHMAEHMPSPDDLASRGGARRARPEPPHSGKRLLQRTPTTKGIIEPHPGGHRAFNLFESSLLCSFPHYHRFAGNNDDIKRQQGNAVPACFARIFFEHIVKSMRAFDRKLASYNLEEDIVMLD
jgi:DNA (cytosine-5)-methyltransferase 1